MPKMTIEHRHQLPATDVRQRLDQLSTRLSSQYGIAAQWSSDTRATFNRAGASGSITVEPGKVTVLVDLSFALTLMKGKVETRIRDELAKALA